MNATAKIAGLLAPIASSPNSDAKVAATVRSEILGVRTTLRVGTLHTLVVDLSNARRSRASMIQISHLVTTFMDGVFILSELEAIIVGLGEAPGADGSVWVRIQVARNEKHLWSLLARLQNFNNSLISVLVILNWYVGCPTESYYYKQPV
jgi:hypothetical protein